MQEITAYDSNGDILANLVQWDKDVFVSIQENEIDDAYPVHFFNYGSDISYVVNSVYSSGLLIAKIPNTLLTTAEMIIGYVYKETGTEQKSIYRFKISMRAKPMPSNYAESGTKDYINIEDVLAECREEAEKIKSWAKTSESWAVGGTDTRTGEDTNNSKYWAQQSGLSANTASTKATAAAASANAAKTSEANSKTSETNAAKSERNAKTSETKAKESENNALSSANTAGTKATEAASSANAAKVSETNAKKSETNSKTSEINAGASEASASSSAESASDSADMAESWAIGGKNIRENENINNAKYYSQQSQTCSDNANSKLQEIIQAAQDVQENSENAASFANKAEVSANQAKLYMEQAQNIVFGDNVVGGATETTDGTKGLVPAPQAGQQNSFLCGDGSWREVGNISFISVEEYRTLKTEG